MNNKIKTNNLINTCYCYEGYSPYTKNGCCRFCFGIHQISNNTSLINGSTFVLTGTLPNLSREIVTEKIENMGGKVTSSISKNTNYLVAGNAPGSKYEKACDLGVTILNEGELLELIQN